LVCGRSQTFMTAGQNDGSSISPVLESFKPAHLRMPERDRHRSGDLTLRSVSGRNRVF
jgi:hypothetical protein